MKLQALPNVPTSKPNSRGSIPSSRSIVHNLIKIVRDSLSRKFDGAAVAAHGHALIARVVSWRRFRAFLMAKIRAC